MRTSTLPAGQFVETCGDILRRNRHRPCRANIPPPPPAAARPPDGAPAGRRCGASVPPGRPAAAATTAARRAAPPTGTPSTASSSAVPVRTDSISIGALLQVLAGHRPAVLPQQRADVQHAGAAAIQVGFIVQENFCTPSPRSSRPKWPGPIDAAAGSDEQLAAALNHVDALVVQERTGHFPASGPCGCCSRSRRPRQQLPCVASR